MKKHKDPLIFIVDDDKLFNRMIELLLKKNNYNNIKCFYNGEECLKNFDLKPDIIILDYNFDNSDHKRLNGLQVLDKINGILHDTKVIMLSGEMHQDNQKIIDAKFNKGIFRYLVKNIENMDVLLKSINGLVLNMVHPENE